MRIRFGPFTLDPESRQLLQGARDIHLTSKAFDLLVALAADRPNALSKATLQQRLWPDTFVAEANLSNLIAEIRAALEDRARSPTFVRTVHGFGYAFCDADAAMSVDATPAGHHPTCWIEWGRRRFPLSPGEHVIGREPDVSLRLEASSVSRRHARLVVSAEGTLLEDVGSKNGTYRGAERVTSPIRLADGDQIRIGTLLVTFHVRGGAMSTDTLARVTS